jgi:uncharacterized glyoxalase superfamily protein PhnB
VSDWISPYFTFNGNCEEAVYFYQQVLGGEAVIMHLGDAPSKSISNCKMPSNMRAALLGITKL